MPFADLRHPRCLYCERPGGRDWRSARAGNLCPGIGIISQPATVNVHTSRIDSWQSAPALDAEWGRLLGRAKGATVFQSMPWLQSWWRAFGASHELCLVLAHVGLRLVGAAPMMIRDAGRRRSLHFIGSTNFAADYCDFLVDPDCPGAIDALVHAVCDVDCDRIDLAHLREDSPNRARIAQVLRQRGLRVSDDPQKAAPTRLLGDSQADRRVVNKKSLKRNVNYFARQGNLQLYRCRDLHDALRYLDVLFAQHRARWAGTPTPSKFHDAAQRSFYRDLVRAQLATGEVTLDVVLLDGKPLACHLGYEFRGTFIWYTPTFDARHADRSPGQVLLKLLLESAIERGLREFDFTLGDEGFKFRFANEIRTVRRLVGHRSLADHWAHRARLAVKRRLGRDGA